MSAGLPQLMVGVVRCGVGVGALSPPGTFGCAGLGFVGPAEPEPAVAELVDGGVVDGVVGRPPGTFGCAGLGFVGPAEPKPAVAELVDGGVVDGVVGRPACCDPENCDPGVPHPKCTTKSAKTKINEVFGIWLWQSHRRI
jgi:hypothetical protein